MTESGEKAPFRRLSIAQIGSRGIPGHSGGVERVLEAVAPRLVDRGHAVDVYCASWSPYHEATYKGVDLVYVKSANQKYFDTFIRSFLATLKTFGGAADIVHYHGSGSAPLALLARLAGKKVIVTIHGLDWQRRKWSLLGQWFLKFGEWAALKFPHRTIVVGPDLKAVLEHRYRTAVDYIPNGVEYREQRLPDKIRAFSLEHRGYILYLARLVPEKQAHVLILAWQHLANKNNLRLVIAGPTWHSQEYVENLKAMLNDDPTVVITGEVDEATLEELYSNCYAYVLPSEVEGMSLSLLDAMAFGACIVTSGIPANAYVVGDAGVTFKVGDADALRGALDRIISDPGLAERLRGAARQRMSEEFHWDAIVRRWETLYLNVAG